MATAPASITPPTISMTRRSCTARRTGSSSSRTRWRHEGSLGCPPGESQEELVCPRRRKFIFGFKLSNSGRRDIAFSRRVASELVQKARPQREEGAGNAGALPHPQPCVRMEEAHKRSHHRSSRNIDIPCAVVITAYLRALPGVH